MIGVRTKDRCLDRGILTPIKVVDIYKNESFNVILDTKVISKLFKKAKSDLIKSKTRVETYFGDTDIQAPYQMDDKEIIFTKGTPLEAHKKCFLLKAKLVQPTTIEQAQKLKEAMVAEGVEKIPLAIKIDFNSKLYLDGNYFSEAAAKDLTTTATANYLQNLATFSKLGAVADNADKTTEMQIACVKPLKTSRRNSFLATFMKGFKKGFLESVLPVTQTLDAYAELQNKGTEVNTLQGPNYQVGVGSMLAELSDQFHSNAIEATWRQNGHLSKDRMSDTNDIIKKFLGLTQTAAGDQATLPIVDRVALLQFLLLDPDTKIGTNFLFQPMQKTADESDHRVKGVLTLPVAKAENRMVVEKWSSFVRDGKVISAEYIISQNDLHFTSDELPLFENCLTSEAPESLCEQPSLRPTIREQDCGQLILGLDAKPESCDYEEWGGGPVGFRTDCKNSEIIVSSDKEFAADVHCDSNALGKLVFSSGESRFNTGCQLKYQGDILIPEDDTNPNKTMPVLKKKPQPDDFKEMVIYALGSIGGVMAAILGGCGVYCWAKFCGCGCSKCLRNCLGKCCDNHDNQDSDDPQGMRRLGSQISLGSRHPGSQLDRFGNPLNLEMQPLRNEEDRMRAMGQQHPQNPNLSPV